MPKCKICGKNIKSKDSLYKDEKSGEILCGICHIKRLEEDLNSPDTEELESVESTKTKNKKFMITLVLGIILITAEILILSDTSGGKAPARMPEKRVGVEQTGSIVTRIFFIHELLMSYKAKYDEFPEALSQLSPEFIAPEIKDESIVYKKIPDLGFILYSKDSEGRAIQPVLSAKGEIAISELKKLSNEK
jgi:hypothetical protein